ncbi:MAG: hypothetical protein ACYDG2_16590 [Ruminiclostridium sp.]
MKIIKHLKKNNGSTLTLVLFMLFMLSVTAIAVITLTGSELSMSVMSSDRSKALLAAQAGAEKAAQVIDEAVAQAQEDARVESSTVVQTTIDATIKKVNADGVTVPVPIPDTSPFYGVIDNSDLNDIKILKEVELNNIYQNEYEYQFNEMINKWIYDQSDSNITDSQKVPLKKDTPNYINGTNSVVGEFTFNDIIENKDGTIVSTLESSDTLEATTSISITSTGVYKSPSNGSIYKRSIKAEFGLLTNTNATTHVPEIPISYGKLTKVRINKDIKPSILSEKALIAQKNIISLGGLVNINNGDVVCFGSIPTDESTGKNIDYDSDSYKFGGIMAGMPSSNNPNEVAKNFWNDKRIGNGNSLKESFTALASKLGIAVETYFTTNHSGSFYINDNVGTLSYLHSLYSNSTFHSNITVKGNAFARSVNVESESNSSVAKFNKIYTYDDLKIDGNNSVVKIGEWDNEDNAIVNGREGTLVGLNTGGEDSKVSSSVIVAGDSKLYINGEVYVGGSTYYSDYTNTSTGDKYISGMSIQKSDSRPASAFEIDGNRENPENAFYLYNNADKSYTPLTIPNDSVQKQKLITQKYDKFGVSIDMMEGGEADIIGKRPQFYIGDRAMHFKYIWDNLWKNTIEFNSYFNTGDIVIKPDTGDRLNGFCSGGVAANSTIYSPFNGFEFDDYIYGIKANNGKQDYLDFMDLFIDNNNTDGFISPTPTKSLDANVNKVNTLTYNNVYEDSSNPITFMYYGGNVVVPDDTVESSINEYSPHDSKGYISGIVYSTGDIYVKAGTKLKGILIAEGNIVFLGDAHIEYDESVVDTLLSSDKPEIGRFFKHTASDIIMNDPSAIIQTIKKADVKNIKIISWKEV